MTWFVRRRLGVRAPAGHKASPTPCLGTYGVRLRPKASVGVLLRCGGRHRRARAGNRSGREGNRGGGREIDWGAGNRWPSREIDRPFIDLAIWGERENKRRKGNERTWSSRRRRLLRASAVRASAVRGASATPLRLPRRERESSAPSSARARPRPSALRLRRPPARKLLPPRASASR